MLLAAVAVVASACGTDWDRLRPRRDGATDVPDGAAMDASDASDADAQTDADADADADAMVPGGGTGCSDGQREGFVDLVRFPRIAACGATWQGSVSLRATSTGAACGDDLRTCTVPADACAAGWHVCARDGARTDLAALSASQCQDEGGPGTFAAGTSHCAPLMTECEYPPLLPCFESGPCSQPMCCGQQCRGGNQCRDAFWPGETNATGTAGCGAFVADEATGVLCCADR
jgi:hypothetical protein